MEAAQRAFEIVPDCPLALWSKAVAVEMLGKTDEAIDLYSQLFLRGVDQLKKPDDDANECWEGPEWTGKLMADCMFRTAGCLATKGQKDKAIEGYKHFLFFLDLGMPSIYSREDALARLKKLVPSDNARREAVVKSTEKMELIAAR